MDGPGLWVGNLADYEKSYRIDLNDLGKPLWRFNMEQQARIIEYDYLGYYKSCGQAYERAAKKTIGNFQTQPPRPAQNYDPRDFDFPGTTP